MPSSMDCHSSGSEEGVGGSCLPEDRAIEPFVFSVPVLSQEGRLVKWWVVAALIPGAAKELSYALRTRQGETSCPLVIPLKQHLDH